MEEKEYITLRAVPLDGGTVPPKTEITLTRRQSEFLVLGGFIKLKQETNAQERADKECCDDGEI